MNDKTLLIVVSLYEELQRFKARCRQTTLAPTYKEVMPMGKMAQLYSSRWEIALVVASWLFFIGGEMVSFPLIRITCKAIARVLP